MYITSAARLRFDIAYNINKLRIEQNRRMHNNSWSMTLPFWCQLDNWHVPYLQRQNTSSNTEQIFMMIALFLPHHMQFMQMLSNPVYNASKLQKFSLILPSLDFAEIFTATPSYYTQHEYCRLLADGKGIFYMECCHSFTPVLDRGPRSSQPW